MQKQFCGHGCDVITVEPLLKDPLKKGQYINYLSTRDFIKKNILLYYI